ncbi:MAG TPA: Hsp20/alpha crystallin family protein [Rhodospirillaceae bacterium]|nr:Hsp20/alpha crystallin family protein [Rhodospirillaceae bacterium]
MPRSGLDLRWLEALTVFARIERRQREVFQLTASGWEPPIDVFETQTGLLVTVALPGVRPSEMETVIGNGELTIRGLRRWPDLQEPSRVHRIELPHGRFERRLPLPHGAYQLIDQEHRDGCLVLTLKRLA